MNPFARRIAVTLGLLAAVGCTASTQEESLGTSRSNLGTCPAGQEPNGIGVCRACPTLFTSGSATASTVSEILYLAGIQNADYTVGNNVGTFDISKTQLASFNFKAPPSGNLSLQPIPVSIPAWPFTISATAVPSVPTLTVSWGKWTAGDSVVAIDATLSGEIDIHITADPIVVNPKLNLNGLPVTITFGADTRGNATVPPSNVSVGSVSQYGSVSDCGAFGWCSGMVSGPIFDHVSSALQSTLSAQFSSALNGQNNSSPFWIGFMSALANQTKFASELTDPAGYHLPTPGSSSAAGTVTRWTCDGIEGYSGGKVTGDFYTDGLCYVDCTPKAQSQVCGANSCGQVDDGCGNTITCPGTCASNEYCQAGQCHVCTPLTVCPNLACGSVSDGCGGFLHCATCGVGMACNASNTCVATGGTGGTYCKDCRANGGVCTIGAGNVPHCIFQ